MSKASDRMMDELQRVGALRELQRFLREHNLDSARSWELLKERVSEHLAKRNLELNRLADFYARLRVVGKKSFSLYKVPKTVKAKLWQAATSNSHEENPFSAEFPIPIATSILRREDTRPKYAGYIDSDSGRALVFCSSRTYRWKEDVPIEDIQPKSRNTYKNANRIYAEHLGCFQAFDVVFIPRGDASVQLRLDICQQGISSSTEELRTAIEHSASSLVSENAQKYFSQPIDLFPAVDSIYKDNTEGSICELHFDCPTGANRRELMRRKKDLRDEIYHRTGVKAVGDITPYKLAVVWDRKDSMNVEVMLPGSLRMLHGNRPLYQFDVAGFPSDDDIEFAVEALLKHV